MDDRGHIPADAAFEPIADDEGRFAARPVQLTGGKPRPRPQRDDLQRARVLDDGVITQDGVARVFAERYADRFRFCKDRKAWFQWDGHHWKLDGRGAAFHYVRLLGREVSQGEDDRVLKEVRKVAFAAGVERFCQDDPAFVVTTDEWDADPFLLGTPGGTVDLRTGRLRPGNPADKITKVTAVTPAESEACPTWLRFLEEVTQGNEPYVRFIRQWGGYCLTGDTREQALCFAYGGGGNGKGVMIRVLAGIMNDYAMMAPMETFTATKGDRHPTDLAALQGRRLVTASETERGRQWAESRIKQLTGGDIISARFMRGDFFEFMPVLKLMIIGNNKPSLSNVDDAARRRFNLLPFDFKPATADQQLDDKLKAEWPGILRWLINGCLDWQKNGLMRPDVVKGATEEYFEAQDVIGAWLDEHCRVDRGNEHRKAATADLFASWSDYARACSEPPGTLVTFADTLKDKGFTPKRGVPNAAGMRVRGFTGIELMRKDRQGAAHD